MSTLHSAERLSMMEFKIELIKTDVTSLKIYKDYFLAGIGSQLHTFDLNSNKLLRKDTLFNGLRIHGIEVNSSGSHILLNAENEVLILKSFFIQLQEADNNDFLSIEIRIPMNDWILVTKWLQYNNFVIVTMHNNVEFYNNETLMLTQNKCDTKCILYCAHVAFETLRECVVFSGTVFSEILVWKPYFSGEVLYKLQGHEGVLFSITYLNSHILSTSDDRSVTLWKVDGNLCNQESHTELTAILVKHKLNGHMARVFCGKILTKHLLSAGEDGRVNIWDFDGNLIKTYNVHHGGSVWSLESDETRNLIVSGGSDASITRLSLVDDSVTRKIKISEGEVPKKLVVLYNEDVVVICESGCLIHYCKETNLVFKVGCFNEFKSYALLEVSLCRKQIVLAGINGNIRIFSLENNELGEEFQHSIPNKRRIFAIHWMTSQHVLTCGLEGILYLWKLHIPSEELVNKYPNVKKGLLLIGKYVLPSSKERWSTAACCIPSLGFAVGDRKGHLHFFKMENTSPSHSIRKAHSHLGITQLHWNANKSVLVSLGRNSTIRNYHIDPSTSQIIPITSDVLPFSWLASQIKDNIILGFLGNDMLLWNYDKRLELFKTTVGGGHRSWDYFSNHFAYIRDKAVNCLKTTQPLEITSSIHSTEMNTMKCLKVSGRGKIMFISGGEDTTLRFSTALKPEKGKCGVDLNNVATIKSHLSSIRCLHIISKTTDKSSTSFYYFVTAGGRGQIIYWLLALKQNGDYLYCRELHSLYEPQDEEIRIMDLSSVENNGVQFVFAACSDGTIKIYNITNNKLVLFKVITYNLKCILKLSLISPNDQNNAPSFLVTMATDGHLCFWKLSEVLEQNRKTKYFYSVKVHQSGVNAFDFKYLGDDTIYCLTGGDDNCICLIVCQYSRKEETLSVLHQYKNVESHCAQITGAYIGDKYFFTSSLDQKLIMFEYNVREELKVDYKAVHCSTISDIKGINVFANGDDFEVVLYGLGIELLSLRKRFLLF